MYNADDDMELDRLSKEAAEKYEAPGNANWSKMQEALDKVLPVEKKRRRFFLIWWLLPILLIGGSAIYFNQKKPIQQISTFPSTSIPLPQNTFKEQKQETEKSNAKELKEANHLSPVLIPSKKSIKKENVKANTDIRIIPSEKGNGSIPEDAPIVSLNKNNQSTLPSSIINVEKEKNITTVDKENSTATISKNNQGLTTEKETIIENKPIVVAESAETAVMTTQTDTSLPKKNNKALLSPIGKGWSFALIAGVDKSTVKFKYGNEPGYNFGISAGYHFNKKWSLHTGAIYTQKNYKLAGEDFTPVKGSWISYFKIDNVEGYCNMWEVPLMFRYALKSNANSNFFLSSGLSSYFMTKEKYNYFYYSNGALVSREASYESSDTHILSILHFSGGFENRISNQFSILIEPYAKLPLSGVGLGNIQLSSFGVNFSAQFRSQAKRK